METKRQLRADLNALRKDFEILKWTLLNPTKFKFGDKVRYVHTHLSCMPEFDATVIHEIEVKQDWAFGRFGTICRKYKVIWEDRQRTFDVYEDEIHLKENE